MPEHDWLIREIPEDERPRERLVAKGSAVPACCQVSAVSTYSLISRTPSGTALHGKLSRLSPAAATSPGRCKRASGSSRT